MMAGPTRNVLYYPFHLCHERTLQRLLEEYGSIHFRDYMALQLTRMSGTTAYADRMGIGTRISSRADALCRDIPSADP